MLGHAILAAKAIKLCPIIMTIITTDCGLAPIMIFKDVLFYNLSMILVLGLLIATALALGVLSILHSTLPCGSPASLSPPTGTP